MEGAYGRLTYELSIYYVQEDDYGIYKCHAATNLGNDLAEIELYSMLYMFNLLQFCLNTCFVIFLCRFRELDLPLYC